MLHQGGVEQIFEEAMTERGLKVQRSTVPTAIEMSENAENLQDPRAFAIKVRRVRNLHGYPVLQGLLGQVTLEHLDREEEKYEIVNARFMLGSDGAHSWVRRALGINVDGDSTGNLFPQDPCVKMTSLLTLCRLRLGSR